MNGEHGRSRVELPVIGGIRSAFDNRFGTPRQPGLAPSSRAQLLLYPPYDQPEALRGLESCSHVWILFLFHRTAARGWKRTVRPPRLGGNRRQGVFAGRSPFRPGAVGLSATSVDGMMREPAGAG